MHITNSEQVTPIHSPHGEVVRELIGKAAGGGDQHSVAHITLPPGTTSLKHYHPVVEESYYILAGRGSLTLGAEKQTLAAGDAVAIPINVVHQIINDGPQPLTFIAVCAPPWTPDCSVFVD
ncbi:MAG: hypothetical protein CL610_11065 [Anaerolineaceae bacterium]|nr:hypothetical protein [Anaerolineaceae bacterium]